jgi:DNA-binding response OmpR family regulator
MTKILLVVTDRDLLSALSRVLKDRGLAVTEAFDGVQGLSGIASDPPDVVVTDQSVPPASVSDLCSEAELREIPVIILVSDKKAFSAEGLGPRCDKTIAYPFYPEELIELISGLTGNAGDVHE